MRARLLQNGSGELEARRPSAAGSRASVVVALLAMVIAFCGCAHASGPSGVHNDIARVQAHISEAQTQTDVIEQQNRRATELTQRIHDKDVLIDRWRETHK